MSNRYFFMYQAAHSVASLPCLNENKQRTETQVNVLILKITCGSALLCELYVVGSDGTVQVCAVKYMCEHERCWNVKMHFTAG